MNSLENEKNETISRGKILKIFMDFSNAEETQYDCAFLTNSNDDISREQRKNLVNFLVNFIDQNGSGYSEIAPKNEVIVKSYKSTEKETSEKREKCKVKDILFQKKNVRTKKKNLIFVIKKVTKQVESHIKNKSPDESINEEKLYDNLLDTKFELKCDSQSQFDSSLNSYNMRNYEYEKTSSINNPFVDSTINGNLNFSNHSNFPNFVNNNIYLTQNIIYVNNPTNSSGKIYDDMISYFKKNKHDPPETSRGKGLQNPEISYNHKNVVRMLNLNENHNDEFNKNPFSLNFNFESTTGKLEKPKYKQEEKEVNFFGVDLYNQESNKVEYDDYNIHI